MQSGRGKREREKVLETKCAFKNSPFPTHACGRAKECIALPCDMCSIFVFLCLLCEHQKRKQNTVPVSDI